MARRFAGTLATLVVGIAIGIDGHRHARRAAAGGAARSTARGRPRQLRRSGRPMRPAGATGSRILEERRSGGALLRGPHVHRRQSAGGHAARSTAASTSCISASARRKWRSSRSTAREIIGVWQHLGNPDTLVWMLAYRDRAHREDVWAKFAADPDWKALSSKYSVPITRERVHDERDGLLAVEVVTQEQEGPPSGGPPITLAFSAPPRSGQASRVLQRTPCRFRKCPLTPRR